MNINTTTKTYAISYDNLEAALTDFMYRLRIVNPATEEIVSIDLDIELNDEGLIEFDADIVRPRVEQSVSNVVQLEFPNV